MWLPLNRPQYAAMVLESDNLGVVFITKPDRENPKQKWVQLEDNIILNVGTRLPLSVFNNEAKAWILNSEVDGLDGYIEMATSPGMAIKCQINYIKEIEGLYSRVLKKSRLQWRNKDDKPLVVMIPDQEGERADELKNTRMRPNDNFEESVKSMRKTIFSLRRSPLTQAKLTEKGWVNLANRTWDNIKNSAFYMEYSRLLP